MLGTSEFEEACKKFELFVSQRLSGADGKLLQIFPLETVFYYLRMTLQQNRQNMSIAQMRLSKSLSFLMSKEILTVPEWFLSWKLGS